MRVLRRSTGIETWYGLDPLCFSESRGSFGSKGLEISSSRAIGRAYLHERHR